MLNIYKKTIKMRMSVINEINGFLMFLTIFMDSGSNIINTTICLRKRNLKMMKKN